jgi:hypothetical protein
MPRLESRNSLRTGAPSDHHPIALERAKISVDIFWEMPFDGVQQIGELDRFPVGHCSDNQDRPPVPDAVQYRAAAALHSPVTTPWMRLADTMDYVRFHRNATAVPI